MNVVKIIMNVLPQKQKEFLQTLLSLIEPAKKEPGCLSYGIYYDIEDRNIFNLTSEWEIRQHLDNYIMSDRFSVLLGTEILLRKPIEIKIFTISASEGIKAVNSVREKNR